VGETVFDHRSILLGFEVNTVALEQGFLEFLRFLHPLSFYQFSIVIFTLLSGQVGEIR
jgi:hypothetical protein